jgi:tetratricopeptide (TPR) repeat protein
MLKKNQIVLIVIVCALMGYLIAQPVKGLIKEENDNATSQQSAAEVAKVDLDYVSEAAKPKIGAAASEISSLEAKLKSTSDEAEKLKLQKELATKWHDVNQAGPSAFYLEQVASQENLFPNWLEAGNRFNDAYKFSQDTLARAAFVRRAAAAFTKALELNPEDLDAKTGLGIANVNGAAASPMEGIRYANLNLGLFSMKSGQYDKAVERFKTVIASKPEVEPYFYLAESYKQLGQKKEAIAAYEQCKDMMSDPAFTQRIDEFINELKN